MIRGAFLSLSVLVALSVRAEPVSGSFHALALSLGQGWPVCAKVTFDRRVAENGGRILVLDTASVDDEMAIRMSEAVIARRGGLSSRAGVAARRHGVSAVALGQGRWEERGPALYLDELIYGAPLNSSGIAYRPVTGTEERSLREGDAVIVDAANGRIFLVASLEAEARVAAAMAAHAYDGLRDVQALEQWLILAEDAGRSAALISELVSRAVEGSMSADDLTRVRRAAERSVSASAREEMRREESLVFTRAARAVKRRAADCFADAAETVDAGALERLSEEARASAEAVAAVARILSLPDGGAAAAARSCQAAARRHARSRAGKTTNFASVAEMGGAEGPQGVDLPADTWEHFVASNDLGDWLARELDDASLGLRRKSVRIQERILTAKFDASSPAGATAFSAAVGGALVIGEDLALKAAGPDVCDRVKEVWAVSWAPGPLGARQRAKRGGTYAGRVRIEKIVPADASGRVFSRDLGSGRRERVFVEVAAGSLDIILAGDAETQAYTLDRSSGRELAPRSGAAGNGVSAERLARVARLARAFDAWKGAGVEVVFSFAGGRLIAHHARVLSTPRAIIAFNDSFAPRVEAQFLNIKPVLR